MNEAERVQFVGGPMHREWHPWTTARWVLVPDSQDWVTGFDPERNELFTLFGEHRYEMRCYAKDGEKVYRLEHVEYKKPTLPPGTVEWKPEPPEVK